jgi:hypothetical protein
MEDLVKLLAWAHEWKIVEISSGLDSVIVLIRTLGGKVVLLSEGRTLEAAAKEAWFQVRIMGAARE